MNNFFHRSQVSGVALCMSKVKVPWVSQWVSQSVSEWVTRSPIELFWTAKKKSLNLNLIFWLMGEVLACALWVPIVNSKTPWKSTQPDNIKSDTEQCSQFAYMHFLIQSMSKMSGVIAFSTTCFLNFTLCISSLSGKRSWSCLIQFPQVS